jgi:hypothetical protein
LKYPNPFTNTRIEISEVSNDKATVVLISFVGAANSPFGISIKCHGIKAPDQFETKQIENSS